MSPLSVFSNGLIVRERHFNDERAILYLGNVLYAGDRLHQHARPQQRALPQPRRAEAPPGKFSVQNFECFARLFFQMTMFSTLVHVLQKLDHNSTIASTEVAFSLITLQPWFRFLSFPKKLLDDAEIC